MRQRLLTAALTLALIASAAPAFAQSQNSPAAGATPGPVSTPGPDASLTPGSTKPLDSGPSRTYAESFEKFVVGDFFLSPKTYNAISPGNSGSSSYAIRGAAEFHLGNLPLMIAEDYRRFGYQHNAGAVTPVVGNFQFFTPTFTAYDQDSNTRLGLRLLDPRLYASIAYTVRSNNYSYPTLRGLGLGIEKLPDFEGPIGIHFGYWYYPDISGTYSYPVGSGTLSYRGYTYQIGATINVGKSPLFLDAGYAGDKLRAKSAPVGVLHQGPFVGLGLHF